MVAPPLRAAIGKRGGPGVLGSQVIVKCWPVATGRNWNKIGKWQQTLQDKVFKTKIELQSWQNWTKRKENYLCRTSLQQIILELALHSRDPLNKDFRDHAEQQHIAAQQKAALQHAHAHSSGYFITQDSAFGNLILPVLPRLDPEWRKYLRWKSDFVISNAKATIIQC